MIRVFIADDHAVLRDGLRAVIAGTSDIEIAGEAAAGEEVLRRATGEVWDVLLLDLSLPDVSGLEVLRRVKRLRPALRVLVLSAHPEDQYALHVLQAGASGFVTKGRPSATLLEAIRAVASRGRYLTPELGDLLLQNASDLPGEPHAALTTRELEVLVHVGRGMLTSEIAQALKLSASTVSTHLAHIKAKLRLSSMGQLAQYALTARLTGR